MTFAAVHARPGVTLSRMWKNGIGLIVGLVTGCIFGCSTTPPWPSRIDHVSQPSASSGSVWVIQNVTVFTGDASNPWLEAQDVWVRANRIAAVRPTGTVPAAGPGVIDGEGRTLLPGYIDAHVHLGLMGAVPWAAVPHVPEHNLHAHLYAGVTTVFDLGGDVTETQKLRERVRRKEIWGPRIFLTHRPITGPGSHPVPMGREMVGAPLGWLVDWWVDQVATDAEAEEEIASRLAAGVDYIKINYDDMPPGAPKLDANVLRKAIETAHQAGSRVVVHATTSQDIVTAASLGADLIAHGPYRDLLTPAQADDLARLGTPVVLTFAGFEARALALQHAWVPHPLVQETTPTEILGPMLAGGDEHAATYPALFSIVHAGQAAQGIWPESVRNLVAAGVPLFVGTDSALPGTYPGGSLHHEMELMHRFGVPLEDVLLGATSRPAEWIAPDADFGRIAPGYVADLVLVSGDPRLDFAALHRIVEVWRDGDRVPRKVAQRPVETR